MNSVVAVVDPVLSSVKLFSTRARNHPGEDSAKSLACFEMRQMACIHRLNLPHRNPTQHQVKVADEVQCLVRCALRGQPGLSSCPNVQGRIHAQRPGHGKFRWVFEISPEQSSGFRIGSLQKPGLARKGKFVGSDERSRPQQLAKLRFPSTPCFRTSDAVGPGHTQFKPIRWLNSKPPTTIGAFENLIRSGTQQR